MKAIAQNEIILLVRDLNAFADRSEKLIHQVQTANTNEITRIENLYTQKRTSYEKTCNAQTTAINKQAEQTFIDAGNIQKEIEKLDRKLLELDKYYKKTKNRKAEILANVTSEKYNGIADYFGAIDQIR